MNSDPGFVDLRLNQQAGQGDDGFWPSFTDIMTVIVMIFLLAMLILLIRNMELLDQLRSTMQAEREAAALARSKDEENVHLAGQLHQMESELLTLRDRLSRMEESAERQQTLIASQRHDIANLSRERDRLRQQSDRRLAQARTVQQALDANRATLAALQAEHNQLVERHAEARRELEASREQRDAMDARLADARLNLSRLQSERDLLDERSQRQRAELENLRRSERQRSEDLARTQADLARIRDERNALQTDYELSRSDLAHTRDSLQQVEREIALLQPRLTAALAERDAAARRNAELEARQTDFDQLRQRQQESSSEVERLRAKVRLQEQALTQAMARLNDANLDLAALQEDFSDLKVRYDDLVKPARSAEGRYLVEVRYEKIDGKPLIRFRERRDQDFRPVSRKELDTMLSRLRDEHAEGLYVRVIIPEDSGLSYNEAFSFTTELHRAHDYYFRE